jgi:hypothetical protein
MQDKCQLSKDKLKYSQKALLTKEIKSLIIQRSVRAPRTTTCSIKRIPLSPSDEYIILN